MKGTKYYIYADQGVGNISIIYKTDSAGYIFYYRRFSKDWSKTNSNISYDSDYRPILFNDAKIMEDEDALLEIL